MTPTTDVLEAAPELDEAAEAEAGEDDGLLDELLIEEVSIDGMCGVY